MEELGQAIVSHRDDFDDEISHTITFNSEGKAQNAKSFHGAHQHLINVVICKNADQASDYVQVQILEVSLIAIQIDLTIL